MVKRGAKLKDALRRHQGKDIKLELQRKSEKQAKKKRSSKNDAQLQEGNNGDEELEDSGGVALNADLEPFEDAVHGPDDESEEWSTDEDEDKDDEDESEEDEEQTFDLSRLDESDSDSEDDIRSNPIRSDPLTKKLVPPTAKGKTNGTISQPIATEDEDIPLSDLSDASDTQDIIPHQRLTINNHPALQRALASFALPLSQLSFSEHQSVTTNEPTEIPDIEDELNRELSFYSQALSSASAARSLLRKEGVPFTRPNDFFAEMVKSDEHMGKIKAKLVDEAAGKKAAQEARKQRDLKKFGKQVQQEKLKERAKEKRDMLDKVKLLKRKRQSSGIGEANEDDMFDVALEDAAASERNAKAERRAKGASGQPAMKGTKRQKRDEKYGFGGKKRFKRSGDARSSADMSAFSTKRMKGGSAGPKRLGKSRRAKMK